MPHEFTALFITVQNIIHNLFSMLIEANFDQKPPSNVLQSSWKFSNNIWTKSVDPWNSMEFFPDPQLHGIPWNFSHTPGFYEVPRKVKFSRNFHGIPWNCMEVFEVPWNYGIMEFHLSWSIPYLKKKS